MPGLFCGRLPAPRLQQLALLGLAAVAQTALGQTAADSTLAATITGSANQVETRRSKGSDESGLVLQVRPGVTLTSRTGRLRGTFSYFADLRHDSASAGDADIAHNLDARLTAEAVENWLFFDATASASRRAVSAFGLQVDPAGRRRDDANQEDVASATLRPYVRGVLGGVVSYNAALNSSASRTRHSQVGDVNQNGADLAIASLGGGLFGWGLNGSHQRTEFLAGRATVDERVFASLYLRPDTDWNFSLRGGRETTDVGSLDKRGYDNWGAGLRWTPSPRTALSADLDERYFGRSWQLVIEHRFARSALRLTSSRGSSSGSGSSGSGNGITAYQLLFEQQFASVQDPVLRDIAVRQYLAFLGIDPNARLPGGALSTAVSLQRRTDLGWTFSGLRLALALQVFTADSRTLDRHTPQLGDAALGQKGLIASAGWRLSPTAAANLSVSHLKTAGTATQAGNDLNSITIGVTEQLGQRTSASINARHSAQSGGPDPYRENAIGATLSYRF